MKEILKHVSRFGVLFTIILVVGLFYSNAKELNFKTRTLEVNQEVGIDSTDVDAGMENENKLFSVSGKMESKAATAAKKSQTVVVIDAGHGGYDVGSLGAKGTREKNNTLAVALKAGVLLEKKSIKVVYTRKSDKVTWPSDVKLDLDSRVNLSNSSNADFFISIHNNSSKYKSVRGTETYYAYGSTRGRALAQIIQNQIVKQAKSKDRGIRASDYYVLKNTKAVAVLIELGFISNTNDEKILSDPGYQEKQARAIADGILKYLEK